jgi:hypothetical protein
MKAILALALFVALSAVPAAYGAPDIFETPAGFAEKGAEILSGAQGVLTLPGGPIEPIAINFPVFDGPGNSNAQALRKFLNREDGIMYQNGLRMTGMSELAHLLQPEFDPNVIGTGAILEDLSNVPRGKLK